jgi:hypothetical protein
VPVAEKWLPYIEERLREADAMIALVTPRSIGRPWLWFEIGAAWLRQRDNQCKIYPLCVPQIEFGSLPQPLASLEALSMGNEGSISYLFATLIRRFGFGELEQLEPNRINSQIPDYSKELAEGGGTGLGPLDVVDALGAFRRAMEQRSEQQHEELVAHIQRLFTAPRSEDLQAVHRSYSRRYGVEYEHQRVECTIGENGQASIKRSARLVAYRRVEAFAIYLHLPESDAAGGLLRPELKSLTPDRTLRVGEPAWLLSRRMSTVEISEPLEPDESLEFVEHEGTDKRLFRTPKNHKASLTPDDYFAWDVSYPTRELELSVHFPPEMVIESAEPNVWVWVGKSRPRHGEEITRIQQHLERRDDDGLTLVLRVPYPLLFVTYAVIWIPDASYTVSGA